MKHFLREYGYLAVMSLCLICCAVLLVSVATDRPLAAVCQPHTPVLRSNRGGEGEHLVEGPEDQAEQETYSQGCLLTEQYLEQQLGSFLPENFPATDLDVSMEGGLLQVELTIDRGALKDYLKDQGVELGLKRWVMLQLLPRKVELACAFVVSADELGLHLSPVSLSAGDKELSLSGLPQSAFAALDQGINALLKNAGVTFRSAEFTQEGLLLR